MITVREARCEHFVTSNTISIELAEILQGLFVAFDRWTLSEWINSVSYYVTSLIYIDIINLRTTILGSMNNKLIASNAQIFFFLNAENLPIYR